MSKKQKPIGNKEYKTYTRHQDRGKGLKLSLYIKTDTDL